MEEKKLTEKESLDIIQQMIQVAKEDHRETGEGWLIWGWLLFVTSLGSVLFSYTGLERYIGLLWWGMLIAGFLVGVLTYLWERKKNINVRTYVQELLDRSAAGFFISLLIMIAASMMSRVNFAFGYYYILYAFWMFIHGSAIRFRPLIIGAVVNWAAAIAIFIIEDFKYDMMVSAVAVLAGYLIPGYMLRSKYRKKMERKTE
jgi:Flp pilus assembly protein TadB